MEGEVYNVVLDSPSASDVAVQNNTINITNAPPIPFLRILKSPGERPSQTEQLKQVDLTPSVSNDTEYTVTIVQAKRQEFREKTYSYTSSSSATAAEIVDNLVSLIDADNYVEVSGNNNSGTLEITGNSGYPDFDAYIDTSQWSNQSNSPASAATSARFKIGQGDQLIAQGLDSATSGNNYTLWYVLATNALLGEYADENTRVDQYYIYANEGGGSFNEFQSAMNNALEGVERRTKATLSFGANYDATGNFAIANGSPGDADSSSGNTTKQAAVAGIINRVSFFHSGDLSSNNADMKVHVNGSSQATFTASGAADTVDVATGLGIPVDDGDIIEVEYDSGSSNPTQSIVNVMIE